MAQKRNQESWKINQLSSKQSDVVLEKAAVAKPVDVDLHSFIGQETKPMVVESPEQLDSSEIITLHVVSND